MSKYPTNFCMFGDKGWDDGMSATSKEKIFCLKNGEWCQYVIDGIEQEGCPNFKEIK